MSARFSCRGFSVNPVKKHFTLIELLVVIAVITILTSMLLPSIKTVRGLAKRSKCSSNIRQITIAAINYSVEYNDYLPGRDAVNGPFLKNRDNGKAPASLSCQIDAYIKNKFSSVIEDAVAYGSNFYSQGGDYNLGKIFACPDQPELSGRSDAYLSQGGVRLDNDWNAMSYNFTKSERIKLASVLSPSAKVYMLDYASTNYVDPFNARTYQAQPSRYIPGSAGVASPYGITHNESDWRWDYLGGYGDYRDLYEGRHNSTVTMGRFDGSAEALHASIPTKFFYGFATNERNIFKIKE